MPIYRFPVLVWEDFEGYFTARWVGDEDQHAGLAGIGRTADEALAQVKEYLAWIYEKEPWRAAPDFLDARLTEFCVAVLPEYRVEKQISPCAEPIPLRVACVYGRRSNDALVGALPALGIHFNYHSPKSLPELVTHYVREKLKGLTPQALARYLPQKTVALEELILQLPRRERRRRNDTEWTALQAVAEPIGARAFRQSYVRAYEREALVADLAQRLNKEKANVILAGETGSGKTAVLVDAVYAIERLRTPSASEDDESGGTRHQFWMTSGARLIAGMRYLGQWEDRCEQVIDELSGFEGVLCVENLLDLVRTGGDEAADSLAAFFLPYLQRGELRLVAEATPAELDAARRLLPGFVDLFQILTLPAFGRDQALAALTRALTALKQQRHVAASGGIVETVYRLFKRFMPYHAFPGQTVAFLAKVFKRARRAAAHSVTPHHVIEQFIRQTGLPEVFLRDEMLLDPAQVLATLQQQVIGQESACRAAAQRITTFKAGLSDPHRPIGVLLFCGPTGVGKTELVKALARFIFGHGEKPDRLIRLDMSEYAGLGAAERLLGAPNGEPSDWIKKVRQQPFVVVLLDEIEKAAPEVFDVLLSVFDEGRLTDRFGRTTIFRSALVIMTSNLGSDKLEAIGFGQAPPPAYDREAMAFFRPEFYNRIDAIVRFQPLDPGTVDAITRKELAEIARREGLAQARIRLTWTDRLVAHLARAGFDRRYGARPLQRTIESRLVAPLARYLLEHPGLRDATVTADLGDPESIRFTVRSSA